MDPETATSGFYALDRHEGRPRPADVRAGARGTASVRAPIDPGPSSLLGTGLSFSTPRFSIATSAGTTTKLSLPFRIGDRGRLPKGLEASLQWTRIDTVSTAPPDPTPSPTPPPVPAGDLALVTPESPGTLVSPTDLVIGDKTMSLSAALPKVAGHYRLTITLHDGDGVAFDAASQALLRTVVVRVTGELDGALAVAPSATFAAGSTVQLPVGAVNLGTSPWGHAAAGADPASAASIIGHWVPLDLLASGVPPDVSTDLAPGLAPNKPAEAALALAVPDPPGDYLLILDIVTPERGSLAAAGIDPDDHPRSTSSHPPCRPRDRMAARAGPPPGRARPEPTRHHRGMPKASPALVRTDAPDLDPAHDPGRTPRSDRSTTSRRMSPRTRSDVGAAARSASAPRPGPTRR